MASIQTHNPENVLKRAEEYVAIGKNDLAITVIFEMLANKRGRAWSPAHEKLMIRYLDLCIELKNSRFAKEGLHQFRNMSINNAPNSVEKVVESMLNKIIAETRNAAKECSSLTVTREVEDLEDDATPESLFLETVTSEKTRERTEREVLLPWLKFLWETFRFVLDLLRGQPKLENLYHDTARRAFAFCEEYSRATEFRRLCTQLRSHIGSEGSKYDQILLNTPETMAAHLETRFEQLRVATVLKIWMEGMSTIEDIHYIISTYDIKSSTKLMGPYYEKLTQLFLVSENYLFHAYAFKKYFVLSKEKKKGLSKEATRALASGVVLAAMSIPLQSSKAGRTLNEEIAQRDRNKHIARLLGFDFNPKRQALINDIFVSKIVDSAHKEVQEIFNLLEKSFEPLELVEKITPLLTYVKGSENLKSYVKPIEKLLVIRLVSQLSKIFTTVRLDYFKDLLAKLDLSYMEVEATLLKAVKARQIGNISVKIDHLQGCLVFGENLLEESRARMLLVDLAEGLHEIVEDYEEQKTEVDALVSLAQKVKDESNDEHFSLLARKEFIEKRKEDLEQKQVEKVKEAQEMQLAASEAQAKQEKLRLERQMERKEQEMEQKLAEEEKLFYFKQDLVAAGVDVAAFDLVNMTENQREKLLRESQKKQEASALEAEKKLKSQSRRFDAFVRAERELKKPNIVNALAKLLEKKRNGHEKLSVSKAENAKQNHENALDIRQRSKRMATTRKVYENPLLKLWKVQGEKDFNQRVKNVCRQQCKDKIVRARERLRRAQEAKRLEEEEKVRIQMLEERRKMEESRRKAEDEERAALPKDTDVERPDTEEPWRRAPPKPSKAPSRIGDDSESIAGQIDRRTATFERKQPESSNPWSRTNYTPKEAVEPKPAKANAWGTSPSTSNTKWERGATTAPASNVYRPPALNRVPESTPDQEARPWRSAAPAPGKKADEPKKASEAGSWRRK